MVNKDPFLIILHSLFPRISLSTNVPVLLGPSFNIYFKDPFLSYFTVIEQWVMSMLGSFVSIGQFIPLPLYDDQ